MDTLYQQLAGSSLSDTLARLESEIRARPADADRRAAFVQLLCLAGNWSRARAQLKSWAALKPQARPTVTLLEQAIAGEEQRARVLAGEDRPRMPQQWAWMENLLAALRATNAADASHLRSAALESAPSNPGRLTLSHGEEGRRFDWLMDGDARFGPVCELIVNGHYYWLPFAAIAEMRFQAPASATDLVWRHTLVTLTDGAEQVCQIPARYPHSDPSEERFLLARATEWLALDAAGEHYLGQGQKVWLNDGDEFPLLSL